MYISITGFITQASVLMKHSLFDPLDSNVAIKDIGFVLIINFSFNKDSLQGTYLNLKRSCDNLNVLYK